MKKAIIILLLAVLLLTLTACSNTGRVRISQNNVWIDNLVLSIRQGYKLSEDVYSIEETETGYNIIIHAVKEEANQ